MDKNGIESLLNRYCTNVQENNIKSITVKQTLFEKIKNMGSIHIDLNNSSSITIKSIKNPFLYL